ncbi:hypothetical protein SAMN03080617_04378, partial [Algoriphagus alkaliphilus]
FNFQTTLTTYTAQKWTFLVNREVFSRSDVGSKANRDDTTITDRQNKWKIYQSTT